MSGKVPSIASSSRIDVPATPCDRWPSHGTRLRSDSTASGMRWPAFRARPWPRFEDLDAGRLDQPIREFLASPPADRVLRGTDQTTNPGLFDELASPGAIVPPERSPGRPGLLGRGGGNPTNERPDKRSRKPRPRRLLVGAAVAVAVVAAGAIALAASQGGDTKNTVAVGPSTTAPTTPAPTVPVIPVLAAVAGSYAVTEVYAGCGTSDHTIGDATITSRSTKRRGSSLSA
jgi:hypothetical protein